MYSIKKLFQEKFTTVLNNKGSVGLAIIIFFALGTIIIPMFLFVINSFTLKVVINQTKENLELSTVYAYKSINTNELGNGNLKFDEIAMKDLMRNEFTRLSINLKDYIDLESLDTKIEYSENEYKYTISSEVWTKKLKYTKNLSILSKMSYTKDPVMGD